ncbi:2-oxoglutarate dehydrogenase E1 component [Rhodothermaceae bacterium RA]|nr:2-oxoglutarate dehydrogenase E1 component [Rhodothermaceae bacterium RA]
MSTLGFNTGYVEELYKQYLEDPQSVSESWRDFFADYRPNESFVATTEARTTPVPEVTPAAPAREAGDGAVQEAITPASADVVEADVEIKPLRGPQAKIVENMEASLGVPTATSVRHIPVKLLAENRQLINEYQRSIGGEKVSFTHLIAYAVVKALAAHPTLNTTFRHADGTPQHVIPKAVNLGLAIDIERRGKRSLLVPNIKHAETLSFAQFLGLYNDLVRRAYRGELQLSDFQGTTATITNPGMIGTSLSVPRLMPGQGVIVGVGAIGFPPEYHALPPDIVSQVGLSQVMTITSTYDHRVIQGAESGAFLAYIAELLSGQHGFYRQVFADLNIPYQPYTLDQDNTPQLVPVFHGTAADMVRKEARVLQLIRAYRVRGHLQADINPLGYDWTYHPELDPSTYGLTIWDLDRTFVTGGLGGQDELPLREILDILRQTYTRKVGVEFMHISSPVEKRWLQERIEPVRCAEPLTAETRKRILQTLNAAEAFERFLHTKYIGHKRFSLEGAETVIPILDTILSDAADQEVKEVVIGMAHRGRLNVLANIMNKPYEAIFSEFEGSIDPNTTQGSGDVKYHLGARGEHVAPSGAKVKLTLASNPSHLEAVNPIVEGMVRAKQELMRQEKADAPGGDYHDAVIPLLIHGDAAFAGQGVVAETLNLSQLRGYSTGGTIHIVINNQIGFTTIPSDARSSTYATDIARMIQAPIFHVNGDDPEACVRVARLALDYRQVFNKDVVIDMLCYRVHGHNEGDEPTYTQPLLYRKIEEKRSPRKIYTESLLRRGEMSPEEVEQMLDDYRDRLQEAFDRTKNLEEKDPEKAIEQLQRRHREEEDHPLPEVDTRARPEDLEAVVHALVNLPEDFNVHRKLIRQFRKRDEVYRAGKIDWAFAEALAFGTLLLDGTLVRLSGQDSRRGTFSHRHAVLYDQETGAEYIPLNHIRDGQASLLVYDSLLSEYAVCGFEYGYSVANPKALVLWEAQFGDFGNGAQIIFDQFLSAAEAKWGQTSSLVLLLPHGYEGQGPEHSSARLERFLQLCAEHNLIVANLTTPANYFHALRRQVKRDTKKPLVLMTPKSLLRHPMVVSSPDDLTGGRFHELYPATTDPAETRRLLFCSGKVYYDLLQALDEHEDKRRETAIVRLEQFYPFPKEAVRAELERYRNAERVLWVQEEPANMGAWNFLRYRFDALLEDLHGDCRHRVGYAGRPPSASPATGSAKVHQLEQERLVQDALGL